MFNSLKDYNIVAFYEAYLRTNLEKAMGPWEITPQESILARIRREHQKTSNWQAARVLFDTHLFVCLN